MDGYCPIATVSFCEIFAERYLALAVDSDRGRKRRVIPAEAGIQAALCLLNKSTIIAKAVLVCEIPSFSHLPGLQPLPPLGGLI